MTAQNPASEVKEPEAIELKVKESEVKIKNLETQVAALEDKIKLLKKTLEGKDKEIQEKDKEIRELEQDNSKFRKEASEYQYALGAATNFRLSDNDKNNSVTLKNDIIDLQDSLENYVTKCKESVTQIDISKVQGLLKKYGSRTVITIDQKPLIKAVLQRHVIEKIHEYARKYFDDPKIWGIEKNIHKKANELIKVAEELVEKRDGVDDTTKVLHIKLRQQIFAALGNRGFNNVINKDKKRTYTHDFIKKNRELLNEEIGKYRKIKNPEKSKEIERMAGSIIHKVVSLFWFRFQVQEPTANEFWFEYGRKIDLDIMEGRWEDDDIDNILVDICYFPLIGNVSTKTVYTRAKILQMYKTDLANGNRSEGLSSGKSESKSN